MEENSILYDSGSNFKITFATIKRPHFIVYNQLFEGYFYPGFTIKMISNSTHSQVLA